MYVRIVFLRNPCTHTAFTIRKYVKVLVQVFCEKLKKQRISRVFVGKTTVNDDDTRMSAEEPKHDRNDEGTLHFKINMSNAEIQHEIKLVRNNIIDNNNICWSWETKLLIIQMHMQTDVFFFYIRINCVTKKLGLL